MLIRFVIFLLINFSGLALGGLFTNTGVSSVWYTTIEKAPWTPPGWVFGAAWTAIMICFAFYMAYAYEAHQNKTNLLLLFALQWVLNLAWNPVFFHFQAVLLALIIIVGLTMLIAYFMLNGLKLMNWKTLLIAPYFIWLLIATSLNAYIYFKN